MYSNSFNIKKITCLIAASIILVLTSCKDTSSTLSDVLVGDEVASRTGFYFDTVISISIFSLEKDGNYSFKERADKILDGCMQISDRYDKLLSAEKENSDIWNINNSNQKETVVSKDTFELIETSIKYANLSNGAFNPSLGSIISLWNFTSNDKQIIPDKKDIEKNIKHTDFCNVIVNKDKSSIIISDNDTKINLGAIAKGFIADKIKDYLCKEKVKSAIINLGGNVLLVGSKPNGSDFKVGIEKPFEGSSTYACVVNSSDKSIVTSGVYERYFEKDDKIYHHILDPKTGYPVENSLYSVSIISDKSVDGDALSTACFVLGLDKGMELIEKTKGVEAVFITNDYKLHTSSGFPKIK